MRAVVNKSNALCKKLLTLAVHESCAEIRKVKLSNSLNFDVEIPGLFIGALHYKKKKKKLDQVNYTPGLVNR